MTKILLSLSLLPLAALLTMPAVQAADSDPGKQVTVTGCLTKGDNPGEFVFTDEATGKKLTVSGAPDLAKHAANHKVKLTGAKHDSENKLVVSKIEHIADSCTAPTQ